MMATNAPTLVALAGMGLLAGGIAMKTDAATAAIVTGSLMLAAAVFGATAGVRARPNGN